MSKLITADCDWINGHLRFGHYELELTDSEFEEFSKMNEDEQEKYVYKNGSLIVDDYEVDEYEYPSNIQVHNA